MLKDLGASYPGISTQKPTHGLLGFLLFFVFCFTATFVVDLSVSGAAQAQTKSLKLYFTHTRERAKITFKKNGRYDQAGLKKLNRFLRDWRRNEPTNMDPRLFDLLWEVYRQSGAKNYIHVVSAYRSPATNEMLRKTRGGQATKSQHMVGKAIDFYIPGVKVSKLRAIGMKLQGGGVGYYPKSASPFVHLDVGSVRAWPRMSRTELVKLFPDGKTLHLPPSGKPLPGYKTALAEYKRRKGKVVTPKIITKPQSQPTLVAKADTSTNSEQPKSRGLLANLFGRNEDRNTGNSANTQNNEPRVEVAALPQVSQNLAPLPRDNIPQPVLLNPGTPVQTEPPQAEITLPETQSDVEQPTIAPSVEVPTPVFENTLVASLDNNPADITGEEENGIQVLAYQEPGDEAPLPSFSAIIAAAIETDKRRRINGEIPAPVIAGVDGSNQQQDKRIDIASLELPTLREHNRLSRVELGKAIAEAASSPTDTNTRKSGRPNLRDALAAKYKSHPTIPDLEQIKISRVAISRESIVAMKPPVRAPKFVNRFMRKPPKLVYTNGFSKQNVDQLRQRSFGGNAVNFLPVAKYSG